AGKKITTIEGLSPDRSHPLQQAWIAEQVPQCGYCQSGMLMTAAALIAKKPKPTDADIDDALGGHICRCGTYQRIRRAVHRAADGGGRWRPAAPSSRPAPRAAAVSWSASASPRAGSRAPRRGRSR